MERLSDYKGADIYSGGAKIGEVTDFFVDAPGACVSGLEGLSSTGIIRTPFRVPAKGILRMDKNRILVDGKMLLYKRSFREEFGEISGRRSSEFYSGRVGDIYFEPDTLEVRSVSIRRGLLDDLILGREQVSIGSISVSDNGLFVINRE